MTNSDVFFHIPLPGLPSPPLPSLLLRSFMLTAIPVSSMVSAGPLLPVCVDNGKKYLDTEGRELFIQ